MCLSMHQPWASLLVYGVKRVEGRGWNTDYRGRLWIHAASKPVEQELITSLEEQYKDIREGIKLPQHYPTSVVLGCVDVVDVLPLAEYNKRKATPTSLPSPPHHHLSQPIYDEDTDSEYLFICTNPQKLLIPIAVTGNHKLWKLPKRIYESAQAALQPIQPI
uniref:ASCH domain-containing protein n=1 Tax=Arcella intermedia TaxID=1963864 RepID=A0A6B2LNL7_9EUKA